MPEGGSRTLYKLCNEEWFVIVLFLLSLDNFAPTISLFLINQHGIEIQDTKYTIYNIYIIYVQVGSSSVNWEGTQLYLWWQQIYIIFEGLGRIELFINSELLMFLFRTLIKNPFVLEILQKTELFIKSELLRLLFFLLFLISNLGFVLLFQIQVKSCPFVLNVCQEDRPVHQLPRYKILCDNRFYVIGLNNA